MIQYSALLIVSLAVPSFSGMAAIASTDEPGQRLQNLTANYQKACLDEACQKQIRKMRKFARWGDPQAQLIVATAYLYGDGLAQDIDKSIYLLEQTAYNQSAKADRYAPKALDMLAKIYRQGIGVQIDLEKATGYLDKLAARGYGPVLYERGLTLLNAGEQTRGMPVLEQASDNGYHPATYMLARMYQLGHHVQQSPAVAAGYYQQLIAADYKDSREQLDVLVAQLSAQADHDTELVQSLTTTLGMEVITVSGDNLGELDPLTLTLQKMKQNKGRYMASTGSWIKGRGCGQTAHSCSGTSGGDLQDQAGESIEGEQGQGERQ